MNRFLFFSFLILCNVFIFSCTQVMHLRPISDESAYFDGKEVVKAERDSIKIVASYNGSYDKYMVFDIEIFNNSDKALTISPKKFLLMPLNMDKNPLYPSDSTFIYQAIDPKEQLQHTEYAIKKQNAQLKTAKIVNTALFIGGIVAILSETGKRNSESTWRAATIGETMIQAASVKRMIDYENYYSNMDKINKEQHLWMNQAFFSTTLAPHTSLRGNIFVQSTQNARFVRLSYPTTNDRITFLFQQSLRKQ